MKRLFDLALSFASLIALFPFFVLIAALIVIESEGPAYFRQERVGRNFRPFYIYKFRTMHLKDRSAGPLVTAQGDKRVTRVGKYLRRYKIDELPQLLNILKGDMSFVGPRPEVMKYVELFQDDYAKILAVRPGLTDPASIKFRNEEDILSASGNWERDYIDIILPEKLRLSGKYLENRSFTGDIALMIDTARGFLRK